MIKTNIGCVRFLHFIVYGGFRTDLKKCYHEVVKMPKPELTKQLIVDTLKAYDEYKS